MFSDIIVEIAKRRYESAMTTGEFEVWKKSATS